LQPSSSAAVDVPKSGHAISLKSLPPAPPLRPDFSVPAWRFSKEREFYPSVKLLGRLFRDVPYDEKLPSMDEDAGLDPSGIITTTLAYLPVSRLPGGCLGSPDRELVKDTSELISDFSREVSYFSHLNSLSDRPYDHLNEGEVFAGTISAPAKDDRKRRDTIVRLQEQMEDLMNDHRMTICGPETRTFEEQAARAWAAWSAARESDMNAFGARSFGWMALGLLFEVFEELKEPEGRN
jgi:RNA-dependent RNA polymerase